MHDAAAIERTRRKFQVLTVVMAERMRRQWAAAEARELGWGGISHVANATGISRTTIVVGVRELKAQETMATLPSPGIRRPGGGRKLLVETDPGLCDALDALVDPVRAAIRRRRCAGLAKARGNLPTNLTSITIR